MKKIITSVEYNHNFPGNIYIEYEEQWTSKKKAKKSPKDSWTEKIQKEHKIIQNIDAYNSNRATFKRTRISYL